MTEPHQRESELERSNRVDLDFPQPSMVPETEAERAARQPLFNRRRMVAWAIVTFVAWFSVTQIIPIAFESAKTAIKERLREATSNTADGRKVIPLPDGKTLIITTTTDAKGHKSTTISSGTEAVERPEIPERPEKAEPPEPPEAGTPATPAGSGAAKITATPTPAAKK